MLCIIHFCQMSLAYKWLVSVTAGGEAKWCTTGPKFPLMRTGQRNCVWVPVTSVLFCQNASQNWVILQFCNVAQSVQWPGYGLVDRGSIPGTAGVFLFATASRSALGPTQSPTQRDVKLTTHLKCIAEVQNGWRYASTPPAWCLAKHGIRLHGVVLS
jgi:hypothetical protein